MKKQYSKPQITSYELARTDVLMTSTEIPPAEPNTTPESQIQHNFLLELFFL